jgi:hypothetical protein
MPSDERVPQALEALAGARETFRAAVAAAAEEVRGFVAAHRSPADGAAERAARELGPFAAGRIDASRFGALFGGAEPLDAGGLEWLGRAHAVLGEAAGTDDRYFQADVPAGADLRNAVIAALGRAGRAFGAARVVELVRGRRFREMDHAAYLESFPPALWTRAERELAPPLVLGVAGADLQVGGLADLLLGSQKIVLVVRAPAPPAALVRLITPGVFVIQTADAAALKALATVGGPAIAAVIPQGGVQFVHDPAAGTTLPARLSVGELPAEEPKAALGRYGAIQQVEELRQLAALVRLTAPQPLALDGAQAGAPAGATLAEKLAAWLLQQSAIPAM